MLLVRIFDYSSLVTPYGIKFIHSGWFLYVMSELLVFRIRLLVIKVDFINETLQSSIKLI